MKGETASGTYVSPAFYRDFEKRSFTTEPSDTRDTFPGAYVFLLDLY